MKVMKWAPTKNLVEFSKLEPNLKGFRQEQPVSDFLRKEMVEVHRDFTRYMRDLYFGETQSFLEEFIDDLHPQEVKRKSLEENLFWWKILYDSSLDDWNCTDGYLDENQHQFAGKEVLTSWLEGWNSATTKFYFVGHKYDDGNFFVIDLLEDKMLNVIVNDPGAVTPMAGEVAIGTLIPFGEGLFTPITDFYRFDYEAREAIGATFKYYFDKYLENNSLSAAFVHVLSIMLQIERRIHLKILRVK